MTEAEKKQMVGLFGVGGLCEQLDADNSLLVAKLVGLLVQSQNGLLESNIQNSEGTDSKDGKSYQMAFYFRAP